jgi:hypothetical protein
MREEVAMNDDYTINKFTYNTPLGSFEAKFDYVHPHSYPGLYPTNFGGVLKQIDPVTDRTILFEPYHINVKNNW